MAKSKKQKMAWGLLVLVAIVGLVVGAYLSPSLGLAQNVNGPFVIVPKDVPANENRGVCGGESYFDDCCALQKSRADECYVAEGKNCRVMDLAHDGECDYIGKEPAPPEPEFLYIDGTYNDPSRQRIEFFKVCCGHLKHYRFQCSGLGSYPKGHYHRRRLGRPSHPCRQMLQEPR